MTKIESKLRELEKLDKAATPGPWKFERIGWDEGHFTYEMNDNNMFLAISELDYTDDNGKPQPMMAKFNSQLIAAYRNETPKLIQALREAVSTLQSIQRMGNVPGSYAATALNGIEALLTEGK